MSMVSIPGQLDETRSEDVPEPPVVPDVVSPKSGKPIGIPTGKVFGENSWPRLCGDAMTRLQDHELPGDTFVSLRFKAKKNRGALFFLPCVLLAFSSDSVVLVRETSAVPDGRGGKTCLYGTPATDIFTARTFCPSIGGLSPYYWSLGWYGLFLATCVVGYFSGRVIRSNRKKSLPEKEKMLSPWCYFLDCARAQYTDKHLAAWFVVMTLAFVHSICVRVVATPENDSMHNACLYYGHWTNRQEYCQPGALLEPSWTVILLATYLCFATALMDQGTIFLQGFDEQKSRGWCLDWLAHPDPEEKRELSPAERDRRQEQIYPTRIKRLNHVTGAAVKFKALIRKQMDKARVRELARNTSLAEFMMFPLYAMAWVWGLEEDGPEGGDLDLDEDFETDLNAIFLPMEFQQDLEKVPKKGAAFTQDLELCGPDALVRASAQYMLRTHGCPAHEEWQAFLGHYDVAKDAVGRWKRRTCDVNIREEYEFCNVLRGLMKAGFLRSHSETLSTHDSDQKDPEKQKVKARTTFSACLGRGCGCRGHIVLGLLAGLLGFYIFSFWAPQGDSYAWVYYPVNATAFVEYRCKETNTTDIKSPWCEAPRSLLMSRTTLWISHSDMLKSVVGGNTFGVVFCSILKALIIGMLGSIFATTVAKTVSGLQQASHPMIILDGVLAWWARNDQMTTCHLQVWKLARDSILHSDVKNILDRYENVVLAYLAVSFWLITDAAAQIALFGNTPNVMGGYTLLLSGGATFVCIQQAMLVQYNQSQHIATLKRLKEATYFSGAEPDRQHQRQVLDAMIARMKDGGDYQTKMLYMPLNPVFQKTLFGYFVTASFAVVLRLVSEAFSRRASAVDWGVLAPANASTAVEWMAGEQQISMTIGGY
ncbi:unnamed protein product [Symbiodinium sp. CCMP2456]|nr:unnamed protein product [Symbiodinium sp. CCMP2456]